MPRKPVVFVAMIFSHKVISPPLMYISYFFLPKSVTENRNEQQKKTEKI